MQPSELHIQNLLTRIQEQRKQWTDDTLKMKSRKYYLSWVQFGSFFPLFSNTVFAAVTTKPHFTIAYGSWFLFTLAYDMHLNHKIEVAKLNVDSWRSLENQLEDFKKQVSRQEQLNSIHERSNELGWWDLR